MEWTSGGGVERRSIDGKMFIKRFRKKVIEKFGPCLAYGVFKLLSKTMRFEIIHGEIPESFWKQKVPVIGAFWHSRILMMPVIYKGNKLSFLVSPHRDGQILGRAFKKFGFRPILGSSDKGGGHALHQMIRAIHEGYDVAIVPDGPKGPCQRVQPGVIELARRTGAPILPVSFSASKRKIMKTWDRFLLPQPFSKGVFIWGKPIYVDREGDWEYLEERRLLLERRLNELTQEADNYFHHGSGG